MEACKETYEENEEEKALDFSCPSRSAPFLTI